MTRATQAHIDLSALRHNFHIVNKYAPGQQVMAVIKANAYGHGAVRVARALSDEGADGFAVAFIDEAQELRDAGIVEPITLLQGVFTPAELALACEQGLDLVVHQVEQVEMLTQAVCAKPFNVWLKLDTGMHRLGLQPEQFAAAYQRLSACSNVSAVRLMSHFSSADDLANDATKKQCACFDSVTAGISADTCLASSASIVGWPTTCRDWVRPGIMLYGASPMLNWRDQVSELQPVMTLTSSIISTRDLPAGEAVGYGANWVAERNSRIGIVGVGYGDGYPRSLPNGTPVLVGGQRVPLVGRVSMDTIAVDLTPCEGAALGAQVTLWGQGLPVDEIAELAGTIPYELLCNLSPRVPRLYID